RGIARADPGAEVLAAAPPAVLAGDEEGNAVLVAGPRGIPADVVARLRADGPFPVEVLEGPRLDFVLWGAC
ncbi:hypothetical protein GB864_17315, partial [Agromyces sp. MMS17-SY077]|nr:hypothetical protein [Agromyces seonyuensis]